LYANETLTVAEIEKAIERLEPAEYELLRAWFEEFEAQRFDAAIAGGVERGDFDRLAEEALAEHRLGLRSCSEVTKPGH
jgi:predicted short-subunit dehydrogenase-like oxidoreductase (DUF2520 family)